MKNKRGFEFSFAWLFAIIVGSVIIFLAVFSATRFIDSERTLGDTEIGKQLGILLNPIETGVESGKVSKISFNTETRIFNDCFEAGNFGRQEISASTKSGIREEWAEPGFPSSFFNKYVFSEDSVEARDLRVFVKPLDMPFKIGDLIFLWNAEEEYCFVNPPGEIERELGALKIPGFNITNSVSECQRNSKRVCFTSSGCDVDVSFNSKSVKKGDEIVYFEDSLVYGAIFASPEIYECQTKRLMKRASELSLLYLEKTEFLTSKGCSSNLAGDLIVYSNVTRIQGSLDIRNSVGLLSEDIRRKNELLSCRLF